MHAGRRFDPADHARRMRAAGFWVDQTIDRLFAESVERMPGKDAIVGYRADVGADKAARRITFAELGDMVARAAAALRGLGVGQGDVVSVQLPNWWEFAVAALATGRIGGVVNPLMPILRERELGYMLAHCEAKVFVVPKVLRGFDHEAMAQALMPKWPKLQRVIVVGGEGADNFDTALLSGTARVEPGECPAKADELGVIMFTSGTTGEPKGVMHNSNSLNACIRALRSRFELRDEDVLLCCSPVGHMTGYAAVLLQGLCQGRTVVLQDVWEPKAGVMIMAKEGVTHTAAATTFLADISDAVAGGAPRPDLRTFLCGGAPIPPAQIERAAAILGLKVSSLWGMTEVLSGTLTEPSRSKEKSASTDGRAVDGIDVCIVDADGRPLAAGETGRLTVRGASMAMGYYKRPDLVPYDADGWFDSGDLAYMDADGYIRINGRTKDVVIRGGENVPVVEVENLLYKHPSVAMAAVVGFPDARLGERCCAFVTLRPGAVFTLGDMRAYMASCQVAKQYWPERLETLPALPMTATGKVQKFALREKAKAFADA